MYKNIDEKVLLSIIVPVFNHERYIEKALDSILMQKCSYNYEVLVGEDCSTDKSREILKNYEKKHPNKIKVFYRDHNLNNEKIKNAVDLRMRASGKYLITLEGDDYWTDPNKIQKQIDFLESHNDYIAVAHNCIVVDENSKPNGELYPESKEKDYTFYHYDYDILPGQLATLMYRNYLLDDKIDYSILQNNFRIGDRLLVIMLFSYGKIYCMQEVMSAYRHITSGGSSYSATYIENPYEDCKFQEWCINYLTKIRNFHAANIVRHIYGRKLKAMYNKKYISTIFFLKKLFFIVNPIIYIYYVIRARRYRRNHFNILLYKKYFE